MSKKVFFKIYDSRGNIKAENWEDAEFISFAKRINGGLGACQIRLGRKFDDYGEYDDVRLNNEVQIWIADEDTDENGVLIYSGYISSYEPFLKGKEEYVMVNLLGFYTLLAQDIYKSGATTEIVETAADIGTMFRNLMVRYKAETSSPKLHYDLDSIRTTGTTGSYTFKMMDYLAAIGSILEMAPVDWYWYVGADNQVQFKGKADDPIHHFILGRHFHSIKVSKSMEKIKNVAHFYDRDAIEEFREDDASIDEYGRRTTRVIDQSVSGIPTAQQIGDTLINSFKDPEVKVVAEIIDNNEDPNLGYDIESIEPGDTCVFEGFDVSLSETFKHNAMITEVEYFLDKVIIVIEPLMAGIVDVQHNTEKAVEKIATDVPSLKSKVKAYQSTPQTIPSGAEVKVQLDTEVFDVQDEFNTANYRFTAKAAGYYLVTGTIRINQLADGKVLNIMIKKNGSFYSYNSFTTGIQMDINAVATDIVYLDAGDYLELYTFHNHGSDRDLVSGVYATFMTIQKIS